MNDSIKREDTATSPVVGSEYVRANPDAKTTRPLAGYPSYPGTCVTVLRVLSLYGICFYCSVASGAEEEPEPYTQAEADGPWTAEMEFVEGAFDDEPKTRVRLILQRSEDLQSWENVKILDEWLDDGTILQEEEAARMFWRLHPMTMDRELVDGTLTVDVDGDAIVGRIEIRTRLWQVITPWVRDFVTIPVPWEEDARVEAGREDAANAAVSEVLTAMIARLESGAFRAGDVLEVRRPIEQ